MKGGTLEALVVSAEDIGHTNLIGKTKYFVIIECGNQCYKTKTSQGNPKEICWNEKFVFELHTPEKEDLLYLKIKIMDEELFTDGGLVGETTIHLKGVVSEGEHKGQADVTPTPYNVILEDGAYKGQISIGLKYTSKFFHMQTVVEEVERGGVVPETERDEKDESVVKVKPSNSILKTISNLWKASWRKLLFCSKQRTNKLSKKKDV